MDEWKLNPIINYCITPAFSFVITQPMLPVINLTNQRKINLQLVLFYCKDEFVVEIPYQVF